MMELAFTDWTTTASYSWQMVTVAATGEPLAVVMIDFASHVEVRWCAGRSDASALEETCHDGVDEAHKHINETIAREGYLFPGGGR